MILAVIFNLVSSLPTFFHSLPKIPVVTAVLEMVIGSGVTVEVGGGFQINLIRRSWLSLRAVKQRPANAPDKIQNSEQGMYILLDREKLTTTNGKAPKKTR
jgi:hypothetical protein